jgi:hypothetical protein
MPLGVLFSGLHHSGGCDIRAAARKASSAFASGSDADSCSQVARDGTGALRAFFWRVRVDERLGRKSKCARAELAFALLLEAALRARRSRTRSGSDRTFP